MNARDTFGEQVQCYFGAYWSKDPSIFLEQASLLNFTLLSIMVILFPDYDIHVLCNVSKKMYVWHKQAGTFESFQFLE